MTPLRPLLYEALAAPFGIVVETTDPRGLQQRFYQEVRKARDPALKALVLCISPENPHSELWLHHPPTEESSGAEEK